MKTVRKASSEKGKSILCLLVILLLSACSSKPKPEPIHVGEDVCANCRMAIIEPQFASEIILASGEALKFDDLACFASGAKNTASEDSRHIFFQDYATHEWIESEKVTIVRSSSLQTPMGSGSVAFANHEQAHKFVAENGGYLSSFQEFLQY
jgi:copper chaperone NosL